MDKRIDWKSFYSGFLQELKGSGKHLAARCPFHDDRQASLSINVETGQYKCHACEATGNGYTFLQRHRGMTQEQAKEYLFKQAGIPLVSKGSGNKSRIKLTVSEYSAAKKLPENFLQGIGLKNGKAGITIPYMDESGQVVSTRQRYSASGTGPKFTWTRGSKAMLYGLWLLGKAREAGYVVLLEGESDSQTLWCHGIPALGAPGATTFQAAWAQYLNGLKIYIHQEPDAGGETFVKKVCAGLVEARFEGEVLCFSIPGYKDPSALHCANPDGFMESWRAAFDMARPINITDIVIQPEEVIPGAPVQLRTPAGWRINGKGVFTFVGKENPVMVKVCPVPVLLTRRLKSIDTGEEKIELSFARDGKWQNVIAQRSNVFQRRTLPMLADKGLPITSEDAKYMVQYLGALEAENLDLLPLVKSASRMGWVGAKKFLPGLAEDIALDIDGGTQALASGYHECGDLEKWKAGMVYARQQTMPRIMMAASFAAPLLKIFGHRVFIIHAWGDSRGGKTAALKAALSIWGEPETLLATFNSTKVGMERLAAFYCDLPMAVDEKQVVGDKQGFVEGLVYLLGLGKGKARGNRGGGVQSFHTWRTIALTTGEEPISGDSSHTGIKTRVMELWGIPLPDEKEARKLHHLTRDHYGFAGPMFVKKLLQELDTNREALMNEYNGFVEYLEKVAPTHMGSHITGIALCCLADYYASQWIFGVDEDAAFNDAFNLSGTVLGMLETAVAADYVERAWDFIIGWLVSYKEKFKSNAQPPRYGFSEPVESVVYVVPTYLEKALKDEGFSPRRVLKELAARERILTEVRGGETRYKVRRAWDGDKVPFIGVKATLH
nr:DUF927 domain-containing protein [Desulforamulus ruminis]